MVQELARAYPEAQIIASDLRAEASDAAFRLDNVTFVAGDILDPQLFESLFRHPIDAVFHLAAALTLVAENSFERGMDINIHALIRLLEACRLQGNSPKLIFASSVSTFGGELPETVDDYVRQTPQTSYGAHKVIGEQLINDYSRRGYLDGRSLRLPIVLTHPGPPTASVSDRIASLIREPLSGQHTVCTIHPDTALAVASVDTVVRSMLKLLTVPAHAFPETRALNLPALTVTPQQITDAVVHRLAPDTSMPIEWDKDPVLQNVVDSWPSHFSSKKALELGLEPDSTVDAIIDAFLDDYSFRQKINIP
ncbi:NAD-dependent epimerase/dehydratase family protein [Pusillimonas harenae]|uniref:NAD-dependent epimerase/dehydratase family protein n=1 Tax=Pollutimonas harenae TaxID=657015 RepID=A0A853GY27_9BURK|nr:NAD-dependent epimerase/dehydratase family protein [Pollutimonas harenae]